MVNEAAAELELIVNEDRRSDDELEISIEVYSLQKRWSAAVAAAQEFTQRQPKEAKGWISWAFALRREKSIPHAEAVLLEGEKRIGSTCALIHYNLACYECVLGHLDEARQHLERSVQLDKKFRDYAKTDPDLAPLWSE
jgi:tetratricopeptide (TPR) repeat protein